MTNTMRPRGVPAVTGSKDTQHLAAAGRGDAVMQMVKFDIAALEKAYAGK